MSGLLRGLSGCDDGCGLFAGKLVQCFQKDVEVEWLCKEVFCAVTKGFLNKAVGIELGHHYDGGTLALYGGQHAESVEFWHDYVQQQKIGVESFHQGKGDDAVFGDAHHFVIAFAVEKFFQAQCETGVIVGNNNGFFILSSKMLYFYCSTDKIRTLKQKTSLYMPFCRVFGIDVLCIGNAKETLSALARVLLHRFATLFNNYFHQFLLRYILLEKRNLPPYLERRGKTNGERRKLMP